VTADFASAVLIGAADGTSYVVISCCNCPFHYWVVASNDCGDSNVSNSTMGTCLPCNTTWTVDDDGKADFNNIQAAVDAASNGDEIIVHPGTYTSTEDDVVDMLGKEIWLHSSAGAEVTIIDGEGVRRGILFENGETSNTIIEGFTITSCYTTDNEGNGSGMYCRNNSPTLINCIFSDNSSMNWGAGIYFENSESIVVNCQFINNYAERWGGGMFCESSNLTLTNCVFQGNISNVSAGGLHLHSSEASVANCTFMNNYAYANGGGMFCFSSSPVLVNCSFDFNTSGGDGGGLRCFSDSSPTITNCTFRNNTAYDLGGAIANVPNGLPVIAGSFFCQNLPEHIYGTWSDDGNNLMFDVCQFDCSDITGDGQVDFDDLLFVINQWGLTNSLADVNDDGIVDVLDLLDMIDNWGVCE